MQRYFINDYLFMNKLVYIKHDLYNHIINVMRLSVNSKIEFVDNLNNVYIAFLIKNDSKNKIAQFKIIDQVFINNELPLNVTIACGISKGNKTDKIVKNCTQLGASNFIFVPTQNCVAKWNDCKKKEHKIKRLQQIAIESSQQSHRDLIPKICIFNNWKDILKYQFDYKLVAYAEISKKKDRENHNKLLNVLRKIKPSQNILVFFGPEGGFTKDEIEIMLNHNFYTIELGHRILRAEIAPIYFLSIISFYFEMLN